MDFFARLDELERLLGDAPRMPLTGLALVKEQVLVGLLADLRAAVPPEARAAHDAREERRLILRRAGSDADALLADARAEVDRIVHDPHLLRDARARGERVLREARATAEKVRTAADAFAASRMEGFEQHLAGLGTVLQREIVAMREGMAVLEERVAAARTRGELPLRPEEELMPTPTGIQHEYHLDPWLTRPHPEPGGGPNSPARDSPLS
jgi:hypothetical protein